MTAPFSKKIPYLLLFGLLITTNYTFAQDTVIGKLVLPNNGICENSILTADEDFDSSNVSELNTTSEFMVELSAPNDSFAINSTVVNIPKNIDIECSQPTLTLLNNNAVNVLDVNCKYDFSETFIDSLLFFDIDVIKERII
ncbi:hypothetical protein OIU83_18505 [Flavobacterium sp. LS1R49]|uniref:Uncharacterized protein n=1 Tax=Flavobacterium shii TaxID=2987687 RepID=A0A9X2ZFE9_9FLAO|nr:hypothetical protein [Flavobacterium shii]MCV9929660.1 hypothetical protein [Flavobacterium shii]